MSEEERAVMIYRIMMTALKSDGIKEIIVTLDPEGELQADIYVEKK